MRVSLVLAGVLAGCQAVFPLADPDAPPERPLPVDAGIDPVCSSTRMLVDDFERAAVGFAWTLNSLASRSTTVDGSLRVGTPTTGGYIVTSRWYYDLRGASFTVRIDGDAMARDGSGSSFELRLTNEVPFEPPVDNADLFGIGLRVTADDRLFALIYEGGPSSTIKSEAFDPAAHRWWRFVRDGEATRWETSRDGATFTLFAQLDTGLPWLGFVKPTLHAVRDAPTPAFTIVIDSVNLSPDLAPLVSTACPATNLVDTFDDGRIDARWSRSFATAPTTLVEADSTARFSYVPGANGAVSNTGALGSSALYRLRGHDLAVHVVEVSVTSGAVDSYVLVLESGAEVRFEHRAPTVSAGPGTLRVVLTAGGRLTTYVTERAFDPGKHRFWRFRADVEGRLFFETRGALDSPWDILGSTTDVAAELDRVGFDCRISGTTDVAQTVRFDDIGPAAP